MLRAIRLKCLNRARHQSLRKSNSKPQQFQLARIFTVFILISILIHLDTVNRQADLVIRAGALLPIALAFFIWVNH